MSENSNNQGRAFEYIFTTRLYEEILKSRKICFVKNSAFLTTYRAYENIDELLKISLRCSTDAIIAALATCEPYLFYNDGNELELLLQSDKSGEIGDVRDVVIRDIKKSWEIGFSLKHNHFAVKHSRLAEHLDFGQKWFDCPCSLHYWEEIRPIFNILEDAKMKKLKWSDLHQKNDIIYMPLLVAFMSEINRINKTNIDGILKLSQYLLGKFDFYKIISIDNKSIGKIQPFNLYGTLNRCIGVVNPKTNIPLSMLPTKIVDLHFKDNSTTTVELLLNNGWAFSFRIHNASTYVEPSLKFDVQLISIPSTILTIDCI